MNDQAIKWDDGKLIHACAGTEVHPGIFLLWTRCRKDVPANTGFRSDAVSVNCNECEIHTCAVCGKEMTNFNHRCAVVDTGAKE